MTPTQLNPKDVAKLLAEGRAVLFDVRDPDEFARRHVKGARLRPLASLDDGPLDVPPGAVPIFTCRSGMRTAANCTRLAAAAGGGALVLAGGVDGWAAAGLPLVEDRKAPLELMRRCRSPPDRWCCSGSRSACWSIPASSASAAFVGAGLTFAGASGFCGMARLLALAPWNRAARA